MTSASGNELTILTSFHSIRPSCCTCSASCTAECFKQLPFLSKLAPSNAGLGPLLVEEEDDAMALLLEVVPLPECDLAGEAEALHIGCDRCCVYDL